MKLNELINKRRILVNQMANDWQTAVALAIKPLLDDGCVTIEYLSAIERNHLQLGPYMVIAPGICLAHARPEDGALKSAASLLTLKSTIAFGNVDNDPVWLVIALAAVDSNSHLEALAELTELLIDEHEMDKIKQADNSEQIWQVLNK